MTASLRRFAGTQFLVGAAPGRAMRNFLTRPRQYPYDGDTFMRTYQNLVQLARMSARQAWLSSNPEVADLLWRMAKEYQAQAAEHAEAAEAAEAAELDIGNPPPWATVVATEQRWPRHDGPGTRAA